MAKTRGAGFNNVAQLEKAIQTARDAEMAKLTLDDVTEEVQSSLAKIYEDILYRELGILDVRYSPRLSHDSPLRDVVASVAARQKGLILSRVTEAVSKIKIPEKVITGLVKGIVAEATAAVAAAIAKRLILDQMQKYAEKNGVALTEGDTLRVCEAVDEAAYYEED